MQDYSWKVNPWVALSDGASIATDATKGNNFAVTLGGNRTIANPTNAHDGQIITYRVKQDGTGSRTLAWGANFRFPTDLPQPVLSTPASSIDFIQFQYNSTDTKWDCISCQLGNAPRYKLITTTGANTFILPSNGEIIEFELISAGAGGGSGRKGATATVRQGGGAGSCGRVVTGKFSIAALGGAGASITINIGAKGTGGASQTTNSTNGNNGTDGGATYITNYLYVEGGKAGVGGGTGAGGQGGSPTGYTATGLNQYGSGSAGSASADGTQATILFQNWAATIAPGDGGAGGGVTTGNVASSGQVGCHGAYDYVNFSISQGTLGGSGTAGSAGGNGSDYTAFLNSTAFLAGGGGGSGGGGGTGTTGAGGGAGGNGGKYGGGGGGGGGATNGATGSGKGGDGADGACFARWY